jgi:delta-1-pyrroline-5-carboxylate synthetase
MQETLLVHKDLNNSEGLDDLLVELEKEGLNSRTLERYWFGMITVSLVWLHIAGVVIYGGPVAHDKLKVPKVDSFRHEYSSMACTLEFVDDVQSAIDHINHYGRYVGFFWAYHLISVYF